MNGAALLVRLLKAQGVSFVTTLSGNGLNPFYVACKQGDLSFVDFRNEQAAAYGADVYARLTRKLGVCAVSSGIAHANAFAGLLNAYYDGSPVLLITGASDQHYRDAGHFQDLDQVAMATPFCKYSKYVHSAARIPFYLREACAHALSGRPGPVHLTIPLDVLTEEVDELDERSLSTLPAAVNHCAAPDPVAVSAAIDLLQRSTRPLLIAGAGIFYDDAVDELANFASLTSVPVQMPIWDRGVIPEPTDYYMGVIGAASGGPQILADADLILVAGAHVDYRIGYLESPQINARARIVRIDIDPGELRQGADPQVAIQADLKSALAALTAEAKRRQLQSFSAWCEEARGRYNDHRKRWAAGPPAGKCTSHHLVEALRPLLDEDILFLVDGGNIGQWVHQLFGDRYPENWVTCGASAVIGWGLGGAIAAKKEFPDRPVLLLSGDGSFGFTIAEIETAVRQCTPFVAVVADDQQWGIVACGQRKQYGKEGVLASALGPTRYDQVAKGFGANGIYIESINQLLPTVREALTAPCVTVIHVPVLHAGPSD